MPIAIKEVDAISNRVDSKLKSRPNKRMLTLSINVKSMNVAAGDKYETVPMQIKQSSQINSRCKST